MKKLFLLGLFLLTSCATVPVPREFAYKPMQTNQYLLASWQKITDSSSSIRIYLEGDGKAFDYRGLPTQNPTPKNKFLRNMAFSDPHANVVYLARPCQFVQDSHCKVEDWTVGRFSEQIVDGGSTFVWSPYHQASRIKNTKVDYDCRLIKSYRLDTILGRYAALLILRLTNTSFRRATTFCWS